jgi:hypothetical protein
MEGEWLIAEGHLFEICREFKLHSQSDVDRGFNLCEAS